VGTSGQLHQPLYANPRGRSRRYPLRTDLDQSGRCTRPQPGSLPCNRLNCRTTRCPARL